MDPQLLRLMSLDDGTSTILPGPIRWRRSASGPKVEAHAPCSILGQQMDEVTAHMAIVMLKKSCSVLDRCAYREMYEQCVRIL